MMLKDFTLFYFSSGKSNLGPPIADLVVYCFLLLCKHTQFILLFNGPLVLFSFLELFDLVVLIRHGGFVGLSTFICLMVKFNIFGKHFGIGSVAVHVRPLDLLNYFSLSTDRFFLHYSARRHTFLNVQYS